MANDTTKKMITLKSSDGEEYVVSEAVAMKSQTISHIIDDGCAQNSIPLPNITSTILAKVLEYCTKHVAATEVAIDTSKSKTTEEGFASKTSDEELKEWNQQFLEVDQATLYHLILAANYLDIKGLLNLTCQKVANMIKGKTPEEIRQTFNIKNDFTPEEEKEIRSQNQWAFE